MLNQERHGSRQGRHDSRQSANRRHNSSRQFNKYSSSHDSNLQHQSTDGTYDNKQWMNSNDYNQQMLFDQFSKGQYSMPGQAIPGQPISASKQTEFEQALFA